MKTLWKWFLIFCVAWVVNFYLHPVSFTFVPSLNTKQMIAVLGLALFAMEILRKRDYGVTNGLIGVMIISALYSVVNMLATDFNGQADYSYANYITTALVWLFGAYTAVYAIRFAHGKATFPLITSYLAAVSAIQCIIALLNDKIPAFEDFVNSIFVIDENFLAETGRMHGLGTTWLDPAGTRFAVVLIMIAFTLVKFPRIYQSTKSVIWLMISFFIIIGIGNMISRTTVTGAAFALLILAFSTKMYTLKFSREHSRIYSTLFTMMVIFVPLGVFLYYTDEYFYDQFRYGFEGFFSLVEKGEWQTDSNDVLATMWRWPTTDMGWLIGYGEYGGFRFGTDIGYCRFILYSGIIGITIFGSLFVYSMIHFSRRYPQYTMFFLLLMVMNFVIWLKVSTDLFQFWAILYVMTERDWLLSINPELEDEDEEEEEEELQPAYTPRSPQMIYSSNNAR